MTEVSYIEFVMDHDHYYLMIDKWADGTYISIESPEGDLVYERNFIIQRGQYNRKSTFYQLTDAEVNRIVLPRII